MHMRSVENLCWHQTMFHTEPWFLRWQGRGHDALGVNLRGKLERRGGKSQVPHPVWNTTKCLYNVCLVTGDNEEPQPTIMEEESHTVSAPFVHPPLPTTSSNESLYESCVSEVDPNSPANKIQSAPYTPSLSPRTHMLESPDCRQRDQPATLSTSSSLSTIREKSQHMDKGQKGGGCTIVKKQGNKERVLASTHVKSTPPLINRGSPVGPLNATYTLSPMDAPYLRGGYTPKTVMKLQEEYRARTKGKLVSLAELTKSRSVSM